MGVPVYADPLDAIVKAQAVIDFTSPEATLAHAQLTAQARCVHVIGTTGFSDDDLPRWTPPRAMPRSCAPAT
jgi:4-hydroxy-tetrahydrodipicolinate reductase